MVQTLCESGVRKKILESGFGNPNPYALALLLVQFGDRVLATSNKIHIQSGAIFVQSGAVFVQLGAVFVWRRLCFPLLPSWPAYTTLPLWSTPTWGAVIEGPTQGGERGCSSPATLPPTTMAPSWAEVVGMGGILPSASAGTASNSSPPAA